MALPEAVYATVESYAASRPMDRHPLSGGLLTRIDGVRVSCMGNADQRGLLITIEHSKRRITELALTRPAAIRNAVYAIVGAMGEPLQFVGTEQDAGVPPWYEFVATSELGDEEGNQID